MSTEFQISPLAILAAALFNAQKKKRILVPQADAAGEVEVEVPSVGIERRGEAIICTLPLESILHFCKIPYHMDFKVVGPKNSKSEKDAVAVIVFEKQSLETQVLASNGKPAPRVNSVMNQFLSEIAPE